MDNSDNHIKLYTSQADAVLADIRRDGVCYSKRAYVLRKYEESAPVFTAAYDWFVTAAQQIVPRPQGAEYPYWAFEDLYSLEQSNDSHIRKLSVPLDEVILFDLYDWNTILCMQYLGGDEQERAAFQQMLAQFGVKRESDVMLTHFYPECRQQMCKSWSRLLRHHEQLKRGERATVRSVQAGLWRIKAEWIIE